MNLQQKIALLLRIFFKRSSYILPGDNMRNKIVGVQDSALDFFGLKFNYHKYYTPQNSLEESLTSTSAFRHTVAKHKGIFVASLPDGAEIFAVKFKIGEDEFPFVSFISNCLYKDGYVFLGLDIKKQVFFTPVF